MRPRPLRDCSALQRDLLHVVAANPGANGAELSRALSRARDECHRQSTISTNMQRLADRELVEKNGNRQERSYRLTDDGRELLRADVEWQRDR